jgi:HSP90 family molecular chaperone
MPSSAAASPDGVSFDAVAKMPEAEREPWLQFWSEVNRTLKKAVANERSLNDP